MGPFCYQHYLAFGLYPVFLFFSFKCSLPVSLPFLHCALLFPFFYLLERELKKLLFCKVRSKTIQGTMALIHSGFTLTSNQWASSFIFWKLICFLKCRAYRLTQLNLRETYPVQKAHSLKEQRSSSEKTL